MQGHPTIGLMSSAYGDHAYCCTSTMHTAYSSTEIAPYRRSDVAGRDESTRNHTKIPWRVMCFQHWRPFRMERSEQIRSTISIVLE